jgi:hypothetical protein
LRGQSSGCDLSLLTVVRGNSSEEVPLVDCGSYRSRRRPALSGGAGRDGPEAPPRPILLIAWRGCASTGPPPLLRRPRSPLLPVLPCSPPRSLIPGSPVVSARALPFLTPACQRARSGRRRQRKPGPGSCLPGEGRLLRCGSGARTHLRAHSESHCHRPWPICSDALHAGPIAVCSVIGPVAAWRRFGLVRQAEGWSASPGTRVPTLSPGVPQGTQSSR